MKFKLDQAFLRYFLFCLIKMVDPVLTFMIFKYYIKFEKFKNKKI